MTFVWQHGDYDTYRAPSRYRCTRVGSISPAYGLLPHELHAIVGGLFLVSYWWCVVLIYGDLSLVRHVGALLSSYVPSIFCIMIPPTFIVIFLGPIFCAAPPNFLRILRACALSFYSFSHRSLFFTFGHILCVKAVPFYLFTSRMSPSRSHGIVHTLFATSIRRCSVVPGTQWRALVTSLSRYDPSYGGS